MTLIIRPHSDLHLEFSNGKFDLPSLPNDNKTVLVLAGDIGVAKHEWSYVPFLSEMSERFMHVIYIQGNHEFYKGKLPTTKHKIANAISNLLNVDVYENETVVIGDVAFICSTFWTSMNNSDPNVILQAHGIMNDYTQIRTGPPHEPWKYKLHPKDTIAIHSQSKDFMFNEIREQKMKGKKVVCVTHHAPHQQSLECQPPWMEENHGKNSPLNYCYYTEYFEEIADLKPELWIHGHIHHSNDYHIEDTRVISNPFGYYNHSENESYNPELIVQV